MRLMASAPLRPLASSLNSIRFYAVGDGRELVPYRRPRAATCSVPAGRRLMAGCAHQQPSYGAHGAVPSSAYAVANTWFCSAADAFPKSAGLPPAATQAE